MGLWSFLGGAAKGFDEESKYNDEQAKRMRDEAMRARQQLLEESTMQENQKFRMEQQKHQGEQDERTSQFRQGEVLRHIELLEARRKEVVDDQKFRIDLQRGEQKFKKDNPQLFGAGKDTFLKSLPVGQRLVYEFLEGISQKPYGDTETPESREGQIDSTLKRIRSEFPNDFPKAVKSEDTDLSTETWIDIGLKGVKTQEKALSIWAQYKSIESLKAKFLNEDKILNHIETLPSGSPGFNPFTATQSEYGEAIRNRGAARQRERESGKTPARVK